MGRLDFELSYFGGIDQRKAYVMKLRMFIISLVGFGFVLFGQDHNLANNDSTFIQNKQEMIGRKSDEQLAALKRAHQHDFDYLLGDWDFTAVNREGRFRGRWTAVRLPETGQVLDEFRILSATGDTDFVSTTLRAYNAIEDRWELVSVDDRGTGLQNLGTAHVDGAEMRIEQRFGFGLSVSWISRIRYYNIQPNQFSWISDRSFDNGNTWIKDYQRIEAHRIGKPHSLEPLTRGKPVI
jgi:hypothetical protein